MSEPAFDLVVSKLRQPLLRPGTVRRTSLIERVGRGGSAPIGSVTAPAGYGKTTLLAQLAAETGLGVAWVSVDELDNDPKVLFTYVAKALDLVQPLGDRVFEALASPSSSVLGSVVPRLGQALASVPEPVLLVLDDVHLLQNTECRAGLSMLADHVPPGSLLALAGRTGSPLRVPRLRAEGRIIEVGPDDLALSREETAALVQGAHLSFPLPT